MSRINTETYLKFLRHIFEDRKKHCSLTKLVGHTNIRLSILKNMFMESSSCLKWNPKQQDLYSLLLNTSHRPFFQQTSNFYPNHVTAIWFASKILPCLHFEPVFLNFPLLLKSNYVFVIWFINSVLVCSVIQHCLCINRTAYLET